MDHELPFVLRVLLNLPHPLELIWLGWVIALPFQIRYLLRRHDPTAQLMKSGDLLNFREVAAVGCVGGFFILTFIFAFCSYLTLQLNHVI